jgi:large subunit ribosomal protein L35
MAAVITPPFTRRHGRARAPGACLAADPAILLERTEMPKMKTKSGAKKRFGRTGTGLIKSANAHKRHRLVSKSKRAKRNNRGTVTLQPGDANLVRVYMPYLRG